MSFDRFPQEDVVRSAEELLALELPPGERAYSHRQVVTTLGERGARLPLGPGALRDGEALHPSFEMRPANMRTRSEVSTKIRAASMHGSSAGKVRAVAVAHALASLNDESMEGLKDAERLTRVTMLSAGDVAYLLYFQEYLAEDGEREMAGIGYGCSACYHTVKQPTVSLGARKISTFEVRSGEALRGVYHLRHPFRLAGKMVSRLLLGPASYSAIYGPASDADLAGTDEQRMRFVAASIRGTDLAPTCSPVVAVQLAEMHQKDLDNAVLVASAVNCEPGPLLEHKCPKCGERNNLLRSWVQPDFFGASRS